MVLDDLIKKDLDFVFCGTAVGNKSSERKSYYADANNKFYSALALTKLTPIRIQPSRYRDLLSYNIGLTDIAKFKSGNDNVLVSEDFDVDAFITKIQKYQPKVVCFNGKGAAAVFLFNDIKKTRHVNYGLLSTKIGESILYVAPSTSGNGYKYWDLNLWHKLKELIN